MAYGEMFELGFITQKKTPKESIKHKVILKSRVYLRGNSHFIIELKKKKKYAIKSKSLFLWWH